MKKLIALLAFVTMLLSGCGVAETEDAPAENIPADGVWATVKDAYVYAFPLVIKGRTYLREHEQNPLKILHFYGMDARVSQ